VFHKADEKLRKMALDLDRFGRAPNNDKKNNRTKRGAAGGNNNDD
jgi:hypothetical protein